MAHTSAGKPLTRRRPPETIAWLMAPHVLIADNDREVAALLAEVLQRFNIRVRHAFDGLEAMDALADPEVAALVCDLDMPRVTGGELLQWLATRSHTPPTVVISGFLDPALVRRLRALPFVRQMLHKPFDLFGFADTVKRLLLESVVARPEGEAGAGEL